MTRRVRTSRRRISPSTFLISDGWKHYILDGHDVFDTPAEAAAAWEQCRVETWRLWLEERPGWPPFGAVHDGLEAGFGERRGPAELLEALDDFRRRRPSTAAQILEPLAVYEAQLRSWLDSQSQEGGDDDAAG